MWLYVDIEGKTLSLMDGDDVYKSWSVGIGMDDFSTNPGVFFISFMTADPKASYSDCTGKGLEDIGTRSMDLNVNGWDGEHGIARPFAIHGTNEPQRIGTKYTHGCIALLNSDIEDLYPYVFCGMTVVVWFQLVDDYLSDSDVCGIIDYRLGQKPNVL